MNNHRVRTDLKNLYNSYYGGGATEWRRIGALCKASNIVKLCSRIPHSTLLEVGAGDGSVLHRLSELEFSDNYYALDISESGIDTITKCGIPHLREATVFDGVTIPYPDGKFDLVILSHVVEHLEHPRQLIYEASRVARYVFVEVPLEHTARLKGDFVSNDVGHINFYNPITIRWLLQSCNLSVLQELITNPSKETHTFQRGARGLALYYIKSLLLSISPTLATSLFSYRSSLVATSNS